MGFLIVLAVLGAIVIGYISIYNGLVQKRIACDGSWAQVSVQLKRRHDLIPNLVESVKGYAAHEKDTFQKVIEARNLATSAQSPAQQVVAENGLSAAMRQLFAVAEAYPDLKANENFMQLQAELATTENLISEVRQNYNNNVQIYNTSIQQLPANFVAARGGFTARAFFELSEAEKAVAEVAPKISF